MENLKTIWILSGAPGSGKSTWVHKNCLPNSLIISRDQIRFDMLKDSDDYFKYENKVWREYIDQISCAIRNPFVDNIYLDATHLNEKSRNKVLNSLGNLVKNININVIYFDICAAVCCQRNALRSGRAKVPENTIINMMYRFQTPTFNEKYKYNEIWRIDAHGNIEKEKRKNECCYSV